MKLTLGYHRFRNRPLLLNLIDTSVTSETALQDSQGVIFNIRERKIFDKGSSFFPFDRIVRDCLLTITQNY